MSERTIDPEDLLAHAGWLRRLALRLVRDADVADDLVQETMIATAQHAPEPRESVRPWLAKVLMNVFRMRARGEQRRSAREQATLILGEDTMPAPDTLVARAEAQRTLVDLVLRLDEPERTIVLLHFCEDVSLADIARAQGIPASTVRWRLKVAIDQLRTWLDAEAGERKRWALLFAVPKGLLVANKASKLIWIIVLLLLLIGGAIVMKRRGGGDDASDSNADRSRLGSGAVALSRSDVRDPKHDVPVWLTQRGAKARRIAGRVIFRGAPVGDASVELASLASESGLVTAPRIRTNEAGEFDFGAQPAMEWSVRASAPGKSSAMLDLDLRNPTSKPAPDRLELELGDCRAAMFGTVRDASGGAIAKARLARIPVSTTNTSMNTASFIPGGPGVLTDDKGAYELCVEPRWPGWVAVEASAQGYGSVVVMALVPGRVKIDLALVPEASIVGRVVRDDTGEPVPLAHVFIPTGNRTGNETTAWRGTFADQTGRFRIDRVAPGRHLVHARADGRSASRGVPVIVEAGQVSREIEIRLEAASTLRGVVMERGKPVAGARVSPTAIDHRTVRTAVSQDDGSFVLEEVPFGPIKFTALPYDVLEPKTFQVSQPRHDGIVIEVDPLATIVGRVVRGGKPAPGANVFVNGPNERDLDELRADANGKFEARGLRPGPWQVHASDDRAGAFGKGERIDLARGARVEVTIELAYAGSIAGKVVDQTGAPVPNVSVEFLHVSIDDAGFAVTDVDGSFRAATLTGGGQYRPRVKLKQLSSTVLRPVGGGEFPTITVAGPDSEVTGIVLAVQYDRLAIAGRVVDADGNPVADTRVIAELVERGEPGFNRGFQDPAATTDVDGKFSIGELAAGNYALEARSPAGARTTVANIRAGRSDVQIVLAMPGSIEGTLVGFKTAPQVTATLQSRDLRATLNASVTGTTFGIRDLAPGTYDVVASTATESASSVVEVLAGRAARVTLKSGGSGTIAGRVRDFRTNKPVEGMTCRALPRGTDLNAVTGEGVRTDALGGFTIATAPAGEIVIACGGLWRLYSRGLRSVTVPVGERANVDVAIVAWRDELAHTTAGFGAEIEETDLAARLVHVAPGGTAAVAGFQNGDVVVSVDGVSVTELAPDGVWILISNRDVGSRVKIAATRGAKTISGELVLHEQR